MPSRRYVFTSRYCSITNSGFPHSEISGSKLTYSSPKHIGVSPVLHRLLVPRHPPCALTNLTFESASGDYSVYLGSLSLSGFQGTNRRDCSLKTKQIITPTFHLILRKEVIQPHLPIRLPCYDFTPIICPTLGGWLLTVTPPTSGVTNSRGVTGGVYKARERIHRGVLIRDY